MEKEEKQKRIIEKAHELIKKTALISDKFPKSTMIAIAVDMAEWAYNNPIEEPISEDLEEEIERHLKECLDIKFPTIDIELIKKDVRYTAEHFVQWQKEQMMANAVEREVKVDAGGYPYIDATELYDYDKDKPLAKKGDKVKVIILNDK